MEGPSGQEMWHVQSKAILVRLTPAYLLIESSRGQCVGGGAGSTGLCRQVLGSQNSGHGLCGLWAALGLQAG